MGLFAKENFLSDSTTKEMIELLEKKVDRHYDELCGLRNRVTELEFELRNAPKYQKGDKVSKGKYIVTGCKQKEESTGVLYNRYIFKRFWYYELVEVLTGDKTELREDKI